LRSQKYWGETHLLDPLEAAAVGSNDLFISCHVLGSVDAMLRFINEVGLLKLEVLVPVHACTQQIILVFLCGMYPLFSIFVVWHLLLFIYRTPSFTLTLSCSERSSHHYRGECLLWWGRKCKCTKHAGMRSSAALVMNCCSFFV